MSFELNLDLNLERKLNSIQEISDTITDYELKLKFLVS